ncbi:hypothetical protein TWF694_006476 [Orbilia ellipsospora]|uniref:Uncharacterized protein n=1 Tax=Orbilia ellipsospora TaxID=2528407 RepID=A0AAV9XLV5_9PEZI
MKPVIAAGNAWSCTVVSFFAVIILTVIGLLFKAEHEVVAGKLSDPDKPQVAAATIFGAVAVYGAFFAFCGCQAWLHTRQPGIAL